MSSSSDSLSGSSSDEDILTPPEIQEAAKVVVENCLPPKSKDRYMKSYESFIQWKNERKCKSLSENVFLAYFGEMATKVKPNTLWVIYSMLKCTILMKHNINLKQYQQLMTMLKRQSNGYKCKKSKVLTSSNVKTFLSEAPDSEYLNHKVALIFGIHGACQSNEIVNISVNDVENHDGVIIVSLRNTKTKIDRTFVVRNESAEIVQKYMSLRPKHIKSDRFFLWYKNNKCIKRVIGRHKIAAMPKAIATYLNLPNPESYTGHCFRRSSATLLADSGANLTTLKRHGGWKSDKVAESYIEDSIQNKSNIVSKINEQINTWPSTSRQSIPMEVQDNIEQTNLEDNQHSVVQLEVKGDFDTEFLKESSPYILNDDDTEKLASPDQQCSVVKIEIKEDIETEDICDEHLDVRSYSSFADEGTTTPLLQKIKHESTSNQTDLIQKTYPLKQQPVENQSSLHPNIDPTALYWSEKLQGLSEKQRIFAEKAINDVLFEAALGNLRKNSVQINESTISVDPISNYVTPKPR